MSKSNYPLIESMGLKPLPGRIYHNRGSQYAAGSETEVICALDLERALAQAPVVQFDMSENMYRFYDKQLGDNEPHTHTARLVGIQPIVRDTAESLLRELIKNREDFELYTGDGAKALEQLKDIERRARRLLGEECKHERTQIWEPHLAGARKCLNCGMIYNPNRSPAWQLEKAHET
jgi:hypothetical protein